MRHEEREGRGRERTWKTERRRKRKHRDKRKPLYERYLTDIYIYITFQINHYKSIATKVIAIIISLNHYNIMSVNIDVPAKQTGTTVIE